MNPETLGPIAAIIIGILALIYAVLAFLVPIFIYYIQVYMKNLLDEQRQANEMFEACLKRILEEEIKANKKLSLITQS